MRTLIIFYSLEGNTRFIANVINEELQGDIIELKPKKKIPSKGFRKFLWGGKQVLFNEKPEIEDIKVDFAKYDLIVFGTPVWASNFAPVFNTFFQKYNIRDKKIALFCCHGGGGEGKTFIKFKEQLKENIFLGETLFQDPLKKDKENNALSAKKWINEIKNDN
ncbi:flavodoxin family protein [Clostridium uliginosum]|uniref:Flavodoxin n=1 Tax=Clostridium uliginosum TaxID=119641 RepID=A0A1I1PZC1_9CLOT|nr:flavodoxin [Clostridium uliginosum]SFD15246.1 Flavodoxin [Clostridium uliginosum]